ncbi:hypothetical protein MKZ38_009762 [Zalerion maritima]|uniref:Cytidyltransferase-like domain-containing protein n=1 Tax=Zalerion maritima TaxID=339359 RepID=A0AAD5S620_9PEZI|nr:hypothetical protein MKZ38_009762 [Zalerion maritima]
MSGASIKWPVRIDMSQDIGFDDGNPPLLAASFSLLDVMPLSPSDSRNDPNIGMMKSRPTTLAPFGEALAAFQSQPSGSLFRVVCSLPAKTNSVSPKQTPRPIRPACFVPSLIVLDSSFNPPTMAHMRMAKSALDSSAPPRRILLLLAVNNADKKAKPEPFEHRLAMMTVFAKDIQESRTGATRYDDVTVDVGLTTQPYFSSKAFAVATSGFYPYNFGQKLEMEQVYLAGFDTLIRIFNPKYYPPDADAHQNLTAMKAALDPFFSRSRLRITVRPSDEWGDLAEQHAYLDGLAKGELDKVGGRASWAAKVELVEGRKPDEEPVSSTKARSACASGDTEALSWLVSSSVRDWIIRENLHAESVDNVAGLLAGFRDSNLSSHGALQAQRLGAHLSMRSPEIGPLKHLFTSDLQRTRKTAEAIAASQPSPKLSIIELADLRERDFRSREGESYRKKAQPSPSLPPLNECSVAAQPESVEEMSTRARRFIERQLISLILDEVSASSSSCTVVVSHGIFLGVLFANLQARFKSQFSGEPLALANTGYVEIVFYKSQTVPRRPRHLLEVAASSSKHIIKLDVKLINCTSHLNGLKRTRGGIGSAQHDEKQRTLESFFGSNTKQRKTNSSDTTA